MARRKPREPETAQIEAATHDGRGIAAMEGKKVFVAGALEGEEVRFIRRKRRRKFDEAELLEVLTPSPKRVSAACAVFGRCGGCALQHISIEEQRAIKFGTLRDNLERIGKVAPEQWLEPLAGPEWHYRRRARLAVKEVHGKGRVLVGFRERHAPFITDMQRCEVLARPVDNLIEPLSAFIGQLSISARLPQIEVAIGDNGVALVFRVLDTPSADDLEGFREFGKQQSLRIWLQPGGLDSLQLAWPDTDPGPLTYALPEFGIEIAFEPVDFVQVNADINQRMVHAAIEYLEPRADDRVLDLYCGIGNFSLPLGRKAGEVLGIEGEASLVQRAADNATRNGLDNVSFRRADLVAVEGKDAWLNEHWDRVLLDPARSGAAEVIAHMRKIDPERIVYVSCHPGTLARDAGTLVNEQGYRLVAAGIIDMFPHTAHVESVAVFCK
jgi:23S rRNA (uracil1939-C5)-methyltransferase